MVFRVFGCEWRIFGKMSCDLNQGGVVKSSKPFYITFKVIATPSPSPITNPNFCLKRPQGFILYFGDITLKTSDKDQYWNSEKDKGVFVIERKV